MRLKKVMAVVLAAALTFSMAACGGKDTTADPTQAPSNTNESTNTNNNTNANANTNTDDTGKTDTPSVPSTPATGTNDEIIIGSWWVQPYDSNSENMDEAIDWVNAQDLPTDTEADLKTNEMTRTIYQLKWDNVTKIEQEYGVKFWWENLTYAGVQDSINTSILAGSPDCDIYLVDAGMAVPAQVNGLAMDLKTFLPADHDILTEQKIASYYDLGDGKACIFYRVSAEKQVEATYPLAFNVQMLEDNNLEDPRALWERGEWTWDKFIEYCQALTQDTDGDGQNDQFGYCGYEFETFEQLMMSNGGTIASGTVETLSSAPVGEALQMMSDMFNTYNVCYPYDYEGDPSNSMRNQYTEGNIGFFPNAAWIMAGNGDYDYDGTLGEVLPFDIAFVRWPVGPSGNKDTNAGKNDVPAEAYIIPAGVAEPEKVFNVMYDFWDWNDGDTSLRDDKEALNWWYKVTAKDEELQNTNFEVMRDCGAHTMFDLWNSMAIGYDFQSLMKGETTPAQFQETYKQLVQDGLDSFFAK